MPRMMNSTQGMATLLPKARYRAEPEAPGISVQPSGNPWSRSHSSGVRRRISRGVSVTGGFCSTDRLLGFSPAPPAVALAAS